MCTVAELQADRVPPPPAAASPSVFAFAAKAASLRARADLSEGADASFLTRRRRHGLGISSWMMGRTPAARERSRCADGFGRLFLHPTPRIITAAHSGG